MTTLASALVSTGSPDAVRSSPVSATDREGAGAFADAHLGPPLQPLEIEPVEEDGGERCLGQIPSHGLRRLQG